MTQYHLFAGITYYPSGGVLDYVLSGSIEELKAAVNNAQYEWAHIADAEMNIVLRMKVHTWLALDGMGMAIQRVGYIWE